MDNNTTQYIVTKDTLEDEQIYMIIPPSYPIQGEVVTAFDTLDDALDFLAAEIERRVTGEHKDVELRF